MSSILFEEVPDRRNTNSLKWGKYQGKDIIPMWVADMDFKSPPAVVDAAIAASEFGNFGYAIAPPSLSNLIVERASSHYQWEIDPSWVVWLPGMVCALNVCCRALKNESSQVFTQIPIYPPFLTAPGNFGLPVVKVPLCLENERFTFDFEKLDKIETNPGDLFMLCHPHNPVGTAYNKSELRRFADWIVSRDLYLCSDEIHCDLILDSELQHFPIASVSTELTSRCITLMAPSKTFNIPGFGCSFAIIPDPRLRVKFKKALQGIVPDPPAMGFILAEAAYRNGEEWRQELLEYLVLNRNTAFERLSAMPFLKPFLPQATYLLWVDARKMPIENPHQHFEMNGVGLSDGKDFGAPGFLRLNLGCTHQLLNEALDRIENSLVLLK